MTRMGYFLLALGLPDTLPWKATRGEIHKKTYVPELNTAQPVCLVTADYHRLPQTNVHVHRRPKKIAGKREIDDFHAN